MALILLKRRQQSPKLFGQLETSGNLFFSAREYHDCVGTREQTIKRIKLQKNEQMKNAGIHFLACGTISSELVCFLWANGRILQSRFKDRFALHAKQH